MMIFLPKEEGQGLVEYGLILVLIAIVIVFILTTLGSAIQNIFSRVVSELMIATN